MNPTHQPVDQPFDQPVDPPVDQAHRDRVRDHHATSVFIEAGAGTGKTTAIVDRVVAMVANATIELRDLAAITFTEAAASELRDRIRHRLERAAAGHDPLVPTDAGQERCRVALGQLDDAALSTLHGFAQRILTEHPLEAGLPMSFEVLDDIQARVSFEQRWAAFVDEIYADETLTPLLLRGLVLGLGPDQLHDIARTLDEHHDRLPEPISDLITADAFDELVATGTARIRDGFSYLFTQRREHCRGDEDLLALHLDSLVAGHEQLVAATEVLDILEALRDLPVLKCGRGRKAAWSVPIEEVRARSAELELTVDELQLSLRHAVLTTLLHRVFAFVRAGAEARRRSGALEFQDLLVLTRNLLRNDPEVRDALSARWQCLFLDEFQDTDPLQIEIAVLLATDDPAASTLAWTEMRVRPGALVVVGDPKQSIYRFRRADLGVYHDAQARLGLDRHDLVENFRSVPGILDFVNVVHAHLLVEDPGVQAAHVALHAARAPLGTGPAVRILGSGVDANIDEVREVEATEIAELVRRIHDEQWPVQSGPQPDSQRGDEIGSRPARYQDIALLIPSRAVLPDLEDAFERAGIPVRVESQSLLFATAEVRDLLAALSAIDDPTDEIAVVAALRSPAFGCSDAELFEFVRHHGHWDYRQDPPADLDPTHPVVAGLAALLSFWEQRWWRSVSETVEAVIRERRSLELALARPIPRDHWRRVRYLLDQARAWDDAGDASLRAFVEWVQQQADERARVLESVAPEPDDDAVRILTVHGAKGLEFPIVILAGLNAIPPNTVRGVVWTPNGAEFGCGVKSAGDRSRRTWTNTPGYPTADARENAHDAAERLRLLYVAMTRAQDHLVLSLHHKSERTSRCPAAKIAESLAKSAGQAVYETLSIPASHRQSSSPASGRTSGASKSPSPISSTTGTQLPGPADREQWLEHRQERLRIAGRPASIAATALAIHPPDPRDLDGFSDDDGFLDAEEAGRPPWRRGRAGTAIGRAVHAVLQTIDLASGDHIETTARAQASAEQIPAREAEIASLADGLRRAPTVQAALTPGNRYWREVPVAAEVEGVLVEGFIDLLIETADGLTIVDYKTDRAPHDDDLDLALARYTPQGAAYALALETALGRTVSTCVFVFARPGAAVERTVPDLRAAIGAVREQLVHTEPA